MTKPQTATASSPRFFAALGAQPYLLLVLAPLFWGGNITAGKLAVGQVDPYLLLMGRWLGATLLCLTVAVPHARRDWPLIRRNLPMLAMYGILGFATFNVLMYNSVYFTAAINGAIEQAAIPVLVLLGNFAIYRVHARNLQVVGLLLTVIGVIWVATHGEPARILALDVNIGDGMVLAACGCYAAYSIALRYKPDIHWLSFILVTASAALVASLGFTLVIGGGVGAMIAALPGTTPVGWLCIVYVMTFPSIIAQLCYARGVDLVGANRASIFINLLPVFGTLLSVLIIGESFEVYHVVASVLVIAGVVTAEYAVRRNAP